MRSKQHIYILVVSVAVVAAAFSLKEYRSRWQAKVRQERIQQFFNSFKNLPYEQVVSGRGAATDLRFDANALGSNVLSAAQRQGLTTQVDRLIHLLADLTFENYYAFRCPTHCLGTNVTDEVQRNAVSNSYVTFYQGRNAGPNGPPRLTGINTTSLVAHLSYQTTADERAASIALRYYDTPAFRMRNSAIRYEESPQALVRSEGKFLFAAVTGFAELTKTKAIKAPLHATFYWSPKHNMWMPWELATYAYSEYYILY